MMDLFNYQPLGRAAKSCNRAPITGMTLTVYDSRYAVTEDILEALGNPERISIAYDPRFEAFAICADPEGDISKKTKQFSNKAVRDTLASVKSCDFTENFYRITNGRRFGKFVLFSTDDLVEVKKVVRNGNN